VKLPMILLCSAMIVSFSPTRAVPEFENCSNVGPSTSDLVKLPNVLNVVGMFGLKFQNMMLQKKFKQQFVELSNEAAQIIQKNTKLGYLLQVEYYVQGNTVIVPNGQLLFSIGYGTEPLDALAELKRQGAFSPQAPKNAENHSYFLWLTKNAGKLKVDSIPCFASKKLLEEALLEAKQRNLEAAFFRSVPNDYINKINRADYWQKVVAKRAQLLKDEQRRARLKAINDEMSQLQSEFNQQYETFQRLVYEYERVQKYQATLSTIKSVTDLISAGFKAGQILSSSGAQPSELGKPSNDLNHAISSTKALAERMFGEHEVLKEDLEKKLTDFSQKDQEANDIFKQENIPIPKNDPPVLVLPRLR
jgi:hypothetical protein